MVKRYPWHPQAPLPSAHDADDALDELSDDAIVAQQTAASVHAPQPRAKVDVQEPSVVIAEPDAAPAPGPRRRGSADKTLVIRDRRTVEEVRRRIKVENERYLRKKRLTSLAIWMVAGVLAFGMGGLLALFATADDTDTEAQAAGSAAAASAIVEPPAAVNQAEVLDLDDQRVRSADDAEAVELDQLPVENTEAIRPEPASTTTPTPPPTRKRRVSAPQAKPQPKPESTIPVPF
jgi:hypothetical protein